VYNVCCKGGGSGNVTEPKRRCECVNECEIVTFSTSISTNTLSASVILDNITDSSDTARRFVAAMETRHRVDASLMKTVFLLTNASEVYDRIRSRIDTEIVNPETSWTKALSKLLISLGNMMSEHIAESTSLLRILNDVYFEHVDYLVTGLSAQLQYCDGLAAEVHSILMREKSMSRAESERLQLLRDTFQNLDTTLQHLGDLLDKEASISSYGMRYFPINLLSGDCELLFHNVEKTATPNFISLIDDVISKWYGDTNPTFRKSVYVNMNHIRSNMTNLLRCLLSYKQELDTFGDQLSTLKLTDTFVYEPPIMLFDKFNMDREWLSSITSQYMANSLSKHDLSEALHAHGGEMLDTADRLYSDIEMSLFSKASDLIDSQEETMGSFYRDLLQRVTSLQRYMFKMDSELEQFMRRLSIWRMPIVNIKQSQVLLALVVK